MSGSHIAFDKTPLWSWLVPLAALVYLALVGAHILPEAAAWSILIATALLLASVFAAVHHAEVLAVRFGEPFGSILLAVAVTVIEVALIVSIMLSGKAGSESVARDTVFSAVMIVLNGVVGVCLVFGGGKHFEQRFQVEGAAAALGVLGTLATITLILPNYTLAAPGPAYSPAQLMFVGVVSLALYASFVFVQTIRHRDYFMDFGEEGEETDAGEKPSVKIASISGVVLVVALTAVILLAKTLSHPLEDGISAAGLPRAFVGVLIAMVVLLPEAMASLRAAMANQLQGSLNLALGSAIASIGLTIPAVAAVSIAFRKELSLGLPPMQIVLLTLTLFIGALTLGTGRTTVLQGIVHLVIFGVFLFLSAVP